MSSTTQCTKWKMPDANHWNGLCTNTFRRVYDANAKVSGDCEICVNPSREIASCAESCIDLRLPRYILLSIPEELTELPHDVFAGASGRNFYDKYPTAVEIRGPHTLEATAWVSGVNVHCHWQKSVLTKRWYKRTRTVTPMPLPGNPFRADVTDSLEIVDIPWDSIGSQSVNPFTHCNDTSPATICGSADWGFVWDLYLSNSYATLEITRSVARHTHIERTSDTSGDQYEFFGTSGGVGSTYVVPQRRGVSGSATGGFMYQPGAPKLVTWRLANPCLKPLPWVLKTDSDVTSPTIDIPSFPNTIEML